MIGDEDIRYIPKPLLPKELLKIVRAILDND